MKASLLLLIGFSLLLAPGHVKAQTYCIPEVINYGPGTPGITRVQFAGLNRVSQTLEDYIYTHQSATLSRGSSDSIRIVYTIDVPICPNMNIRVWVDLNNDGVFTEPSELLVSKDKDVSRDYKTVLSIPSTAMLGTTRMRVGVKMSDDGGHTDPTPCNQPPDPDDWHGEIEDYDLVIIPATGIAEYAQALPALPLAPNPASGSLSFGTHISGTLSILDIHGKLIRTIEAGNGTPVDISDLPLGLYLISHPSFSATRFVKQ